MNFFESMFYFLDTLTAFDTCCLIAIYSMFLLLFANACMKFKLSNIAECLHIIIFCVIIFTCFCLYLIDERSFNVLRNSSFLRTAYVTNIAVFSIYMIYNIYKNRGLFMINGNSFECEKGCVHGVKKVDDNFKKQSELGCNDRDGVYKDYNYYYRYNYDKYAEPYTSTPVTDCTGNVYASQDVSSFKNETRTSCCINNNNFENYETCRRMNNQNFKNRFEYYSEDDFINDMNFEENNFNYKSNNDAINVSEKINFSQSNNDTSHNNCNNKIMPSAFNNNSYDLCKESNVLDKVKNMLQENNTSFDERIGLVRVDMEKLRDSIQGIVDRITKMFELFTVVLQQQKSSRD